jgi:hypothetical protein
MHAFLKDHEPPVGDRVRVFLVDSASWVITQHRDRSIKPLAGRVGTGVAKVEGAQDLNLPSSISSDISFELIRKYDPGISDVANAPALKIYEMAANKKPS